MNPDVLTDQTTDVSVCVLARHRLYRLAGVYQDLCAYFGKNGLFFECIVVANGLDLEEASTLARFSSSFPSENGRLKIIHVREKLDKASSIKAVQHLIRGKVVLTLETAGGEIPMGDIHRLLAALNQGFDFVNGVRDWKGEPLLNQWQSKLFNWCTRLVTGSKGRDLNSTLKVMTREVLNGIPLYGDFYRFLPVLAERSGFRVCEVPLERREEQRKSTIYGPISYVRRFLEILNLIFITRFTEKPLRFFGGWGVFSVGMGILISLVLVIQKIFLGEQMADRPLLLLGILLIVAGIQSISLGLIGEMIVYSRTKEAKGSEIEEIL